MSRNFELLRRVERERHHRPGGDLPSTPAPSNPELRPSSPLYSALFDSGVAKEDSGWTEPLLGGEIVEGVSVPLHKDAREQVVNLVKELFLVSASKVRSVAVSATEPGRNAGAITLAVAECLASMTSERVCLVDVDFDHSQLQSLMRTASAHGLSDVLRDEASLGSVLTRASSNLWIVPAGTSAGLAGGQNTADLVEVLNALRRETDYLLLHLPPLSDTSSAIAFGKMTDGMIVVVEANRTRRDFAQTLKAKLDAAHVRVLGAVFNNRRYPIPKSIYSKL